MVAEFKATVEAGGTPKSTVFFLGRENFPQYYVEEMNYSLKNEAVLLDQEKPKGLILTTGSLVPMALEMGEKENYCVLSKTWINGEFTNEIKSHLEKAQGNLIVMEDHQKISGFGSFALMKLTEQFGADLIKSFKSIAVDGKFGRSAYKARQLYDQYLTL